MTRLVDRAAGALAKLDSRRKFLSRTAMVGTAMEDFGKVVSGWDSRSFSQGLAPEVLANRNPPRLINSSVAPSNVGTVV